MAVALATSACGAASEPVSEVSAFELYEAKKWSLAYKQLLPLAEQGNGGAMLLLGEMLLHGQGTHQDIDAGLRWLERSAELGHGRDAYYTAGRYFAKWSSNWTRASEYVIAAAELGHPDAQAMLAEMYAIGRGVPRDSSQAEKWYRLAAEHSENTWVAYRAARSYLEGDEREYVKAVELLHSAAEGGHALAQDDLGVLYMDGALIGRDLSRAEHWLTLAVEQRVPTAFIHMGSLYLQVGQPKNAIRCYIDAWRAGREAENQQVIKEALAALMVGGIVGHIDAETRVIAKHDQSPIGACKADPLELFAIMAESYWDDAQRRRR